MNKKASEKDFMNLYGKFILGQCNRDELLALFYMLHSDKAAELMHHDMHRENFDDGSQKISADDKKRIIRAAKREIGFRKNTLFAVLRAVGRYAAIVVLICGLWWAVRPDDDRATQKMETVYSAGKKSAVVLADGTRVDLNVNSVLRYPASFDGDSREVELSGEAFFEVAHDVARPFVVHAGAQRIEVLGTSFNVRCYGGESAIETTLIEGRVLLDCEAGSVILQPGQQALFSTLESELEVKSADVGNFVAWKTGKYSFVNQTFDAIIAVLERGFGVSIQIMNEELKHKSYTMRFENGESLEKILELIKINGKFEYRYQNGQIIIE